MKSGFSRKLCPSAHIGGQVLTSEGQTCSLGTAFTTGIIFIDIYTTKPQHQIKVAEILSQVLVDTRALYGDSYGRWLAGSIHKSVDGTRVIVYERFSNRRAAEHIHGERHSQPAEHALNRLATRDRHLYTPFPFEDYAKPPRE